MSHSHDKEDYGMLNQTFTKHIFESEIKDDNYSGILSVFSSNIVKTQMQLMKKFNEDFGHKFLKCIFEYAAKILPTCEESLRVKIEKMQDKVKGL